MGVLARLWFGLEGRVSRRAYAATGFGLMAFKYAIEVAVIRALAGAWWSPFDYFGPFYANRAEALAGGPEWLALALGLWTLPFVWIGVSMTMRRALDAGLSPWFGILFLLPLVNYAVMLALACVPSRPPRDEHATPARAGPALRAALFALMASLPVAALLYFLAVHVVVEYGTALFLGVPFFMGALVGRIYNHGTRRLLVATVALASVAVFMGCGFMLLFALEGVLCVALALPVVLPLAVLGAVFGRALAPAARLPAQAGLASLCLPLWLWLEHRHAPTPVFELVSTVEIDALPERVWPNVVGFAELPAPEHWIFHTGIAYPARAHIEGSGVGAVRHCEFSTGPFVEPITRWEPPARLSFGVTAQPDPMEEWSFYSRVRPPHLERSFRALRGEFRLVALPGGRTRLEGSTWYALDLAPAGYWRLLADGIVHRIHRRVLEHVRRLSEEDASAAGR